MQSLWIDEQFTYDGTQLRGLYAYLKHGILGDSVVSWIGPCSISNEMMMDGEDLRSGSEIRGGKMVHFIFELFDRDLVSGVLIQRAFAMTCREWIEENSKTRLIRMGDDIFWNSKKLSISIAVKAPSSVLIHFALNITNEGTPVPTCCLEDFKVDPKTFANEVMLRMTTEYQSILDASRKVRSAPSL